MVQICIKENTLDFFEQLLNSLLKSSDRTLLFASRQIVDTLVDNVLTLDSKMATGKLDFTTTVLFRKMKQKNWFIVCKFVLNNLILA